MKRAAIIISRLDDLRKTGAVSINNTGGAIKTRGKKLYLSVMRIALFQRG
jgi:hypothetical protein